VKARRSTEGLRATSITLVVILVFAFDATFASRATASSVCAGLFEPSETTLPPQLALLLSQLPLRQRLKFEERFEKRQEVSAEREASRLLARFLINGDGADLRLKPLASTETRADTIKSLLNARLEIESNRIKLENILIEIGYSEGSPTSQQWRAFRDRYDSQLAVAKSVAMNVASTYVLGLPFFLNRVKTANFKVSRDERRAWPTVEKELRSRIANEDPEAIRKIKYEFALDFVRRIVAIAVLAMLTDEFLTYLTPKWGLLKLKVRGSLVIESRERLETQAFENWKDIDEAFTGSRPADDSPEARDILARIHASSKDELWLYLNEGGALTEPRANSTLGISTPQTN
jgi:hypothetical protein